MDAAEGLTTATEPVAFLAGPTASGKTSAGVALAREFGLAIVSADSMQVYRGVEIGTAQPTMAERGGIPHELLGVAEPGEEFHAARFAEEARRAIARHAGEGRRSLVVGGTGLWIRALRSGLFAGPGRSDEIRSRLRAMMAAEGVAALHALLANRDPLAAGAVHPADHVRVIRALEVHELTGRSIIEWHREDAARRAKLPPPRPMVVVTPDRAAHERAITARIDAMLAAGWLGEAEGLLSRGLPDHAPPMKALGYPELFGVLRGEHSLEEARSLIVVATRQLARDQRKWFRSELRAEHMPPGVALERLRDIIARG